MLHCLPKIFLLIVTITFITLPLYAQLNSVIHEKFDNNLQGWPLIDEPECRAIIENGRLRISKYAGKPRILALHRFIPEIENFILEGEFTNTEYATKQGVGLVWGHHADSHRNNFFVLSPDGYFIILTDNKLGKDIGEWEKCEAIHPASRVNKIKVEQRDFQLYFYINNHLVKRIKHLPWFGKEFGVIVFANQKVEIDNFKLTAQTQINLPYPLQKGFVKENLGPNINTKYAEINPIISQDGRTLYFARKNSPENVGGVPDKQDIWYAKSNDGMHWSKSKNAGRIINSTRPDNLTAISADNNVMMFYYPGAKTKGGFGIRKRTELGWSRIQRLDLDLQNESEFIESSLSADGNAILFTAKTKSNIKYQPLVDERDIYVCLRNDDDTWTKPLNLGEAVNTADDEYSPFLAADGRTLYFGTNGRPGYGKVDIFMTKRIGSGWTHWTEPVNLGPEINTPYFDAYYTVPASGKYAYMVSYQNSNGDADIVRIKLPEVLKPDPVILVKGKVLHAKDKTPVYATLIVKDVATDQSYTQATSDPTAGVYKIILPYGKIYTLEASAKGYLPVNEKLALQDFNLYTEIEKDIFLTPISKGDVIKLSHVLFEQSTPHLLLSSYRELDHLVRIMKENPTMEIELSGHTDNVGTPASLLKLSQDRMDTVKKYLAEKGIQAKRISGRGYGATQPVAKNDSDENKSKNRRVDFKILNE